MKKIVLFLLFSLHLSVFSLCAQVRMRDVFASMPDSLLPMMTKNNRLDCIDFIENNMEAKVRNKLDQFVELKKMTDDYLLLETSDVSRVEMKFLHTTDSTGIIYVVHTCLGPAADSYLSCYTQQWEPRVGIERPAVQEFFEQGSGEDADALQGAILMLQDLTFLEARLSETEPTLTWSICLDELTRDEKKVAEKYVKRGNLLSKKLQK